MRLERGAARRGGHSRWPAIGGVGSRRCRASTARSTAAPPSSVRVVDADEWQSSVGYRVLGEYRLDGTFGLARATVDTLFGVDHEHAADLVDAVDRADSMHERSFTSMQGSVMMYVTSEFPSDPGWAS